MGQKKRDDIFFFNAAPHQNVVEFMPAAGDWPCTTPTPSLLAMAPLPLIVCVLPSELQPTNELLMMMTVTV